MTVEELIKILQTFSLDLEVKFISTENWMDEMIIQDVLPNREDGGPLLV